MNIAKAQDFLSSSNQHLCQEAKQKIRRFFEIVKIPQNFLNELPVLLHEFDNKVLTFSCLSEVYEEFEPIYFIKGMLKRYLSININQRFLEQTQYIFYHNNYPNRRFCLIWATFLFNELEIQKLEVSPCFQEIKIGLKQTHLIPALLATRALTDNEKSLSIHHRLILQCDKWPQLYDKNLLSKLHHFLIVSDDEFRHMRDVSHMCKMITTFYLYQKDINLLIKENPKSRLLKLKLLQSKLHYSFASKKVLGLIVVICFTKRYELFEERHILKAIQKFIPDVIAVPNSFLSFQDSRDGICQFYLEVEKKDDTEFSQTDIHSLSYTLSSELKASIEQLVPSVFMPRNEEEVMRNIMTLSRELRFVQDIPQVIISYKDQTTEDLTFNIIIVRILKENEQDLQIIFKKLPSEYVCVIEQTKNIGFVRRRYPKESSVLSLTFPKSDYLRNDYSVDLYKAREQVVNLLRQNLGEIRDYNGGLIIKQNQVLAHVRKLLNLSENEPDHQLENLFYSIFPAISQSLLCPQLIQLLYSLLKKVNNRADLNKKNYIYEILFHKINVLMMIRAQNGTLIQELLLKLKAHSTEKELVWSNFQLGDEHCLGLIFIHEDSTERLIFCRIVEQILHNWSSLQKKEQILRLCMQSSPSSLHPRKGLDRTSELIIKMMYEGLMTLDQSGRPQCALAKKIDVSQDLKKYTYTLRSSFWSNGLKVTAYDFEYAWKSMLATELERPFAYLFFPILNAKKIFQGKLPLDQLGVKAINEETLVVDLEYPTPYFNELTTLWVYYPLCQIEDRKNSDWASYPGENFINNGPFILKEWKRHYKIKLAKNINYWNQKKVHLEELDINLVDNIHKALHHYDQNLIDYIGDPLIEIPLSRMSYPKTSDKVVTTKTLGLVQCEFNTTIFPFNHVKIRKALSLILDRKKISKETFKGYFHPARGFFPSLLSVDQKNYFEEVDKIEVTRIFHEGLNDLELTSETFPEIKLQVLDSETHLEAANAIIEQWSNLFGISAHIESLCWKSFLHRLNTGDFQIGISSWFSWIKDPTYFLDFLRNSQNDKSLSRWNNLQFEKILHAIKKNKIESERTSLLFEAEKIIMDQVPVFPIVEHCYRSMMKENIRNIFISATGKIDFSQSRITSENKTLINYGLWRTIREDYIENEERDTSIFIDKPVETIISNDCNSPKTNFLRIAAKNDPNSLDPRIVGDRRSQAVLFQLFEGLMRMNAKGQIEPAVASNVLISHDRCQYTFLLKETFWSNGDPVTAFDFEYAWKKVLSPQFSSVYSYVFFMIKNAKKAKENQGSLQDVGIKALDEKTLQVILEHPAPYFLECIANPIYSPINKKMDLENDCWNNPNKLISNGPFKLAYWKIHEELCLVKNPFYYDKKSIKLDGLNFIIVPDERKAWFLFEKNELDWVGEPTSYLPLELVPKLYKEKKLGICPASAVFWYLFNINQFPFNHEKIRKAFGHAIDRKSLVKLFLQGGEEPALSILPQHSFVKHKVYLKDNDIQTALQLFDEALKELQLTKENFPAIVLSCTPKSQLVSQMVVQKWKELFNINIELDCCKWNQHIEKLLRKEYHIASWGWDSWFNDPIYNLEYHKFRDNPIIHTGWQNQRYAMLLEQSDREIYNDARSRCLRAAEKLLLDEMPIVPVYYFANTYLKKQRVQGVFSNSIGMIDFKWAYFS